MICLSPLVAVLGTAVVLTTGCDTVSETLNKRPPVDVAHLLAP